MENQLDLATASLEDLENIDIESILGGDVSNFDITSTLPDCVVGVVLEDFELAKKAADTEEGKKASVQLVLKFKIMHVFTCDDPDVDTASLIGKYHYERLLVTQDWGKARAIKIILGALGLSFRDKKTWADAGGSFAELLSELKAAKIQFGTTIKTKERNGFENTNIVDKEKAFINMEAYQSAVG